MRVSAAELQNIFPWLLTRVFVAAQKRHVDERKGRRTNE